mgnify:CR=1 FL=1
MNAPGPTIALIVAAGRGRRFGGPVPKQYATLAGEPVIRHCVRAFQKHPAIDAIKVVIGPDDYADYAAALTGFDLLPPTIGGETRQDSVRLGLVALSTLAPARVLIHDAARHANKIILGLLADSCQIRHRHIPMEKFVKTKCNRCFYCCAA